MRLTQAESEQNRKRILEVAGRLFRQRGFDEVGVDDLMKAAGFTHGGFYNHFASKEELEVEASAAGAVPALAAPGRPPGDPRTEGWKKVVRGPPSAGHRRGSAGGGPGGAPAAGAASARLAPRRRGGRDPPPRRSAATVLDGERLRLYD